MENGDQVRLYLTDLEFLIENSFNDWLYANVESQNAVTVLSILTIYIGHRSSVEQTSKVLIQSKGVKINSD